MWNSLTNNLRFCIIKAYIVASLLLSGKKRMVKLNKQYNKKYIRRIIKNPSKAVCKKCKKGLNFVQDPMDHGEMYEYFECKNCSIIIEIDRKKKTHGKNKKIDKAIVNITKSIVKVENQYDPDNIFFEMIRTKLKDTYYEIGNNILYNPIQKKIRHRNNERDADDNEHNEMVNNIFINIGNHE